MVATSRRKSIVGRIDQCIRPAFYSVFGAAFLIEMWLLFIAPDATQQKYITPATVLLSAIMATCGWMWTGHLNRRLARKTQAISLLLALRQQQVNDWKKTVYQFMDLQGQGQKPEVPLEDIEKLLGL